MTQARGAGLHLILWIFACVAALSVPSTALAQAPVKAMQRPITADSAPERIVYEVFFYAVAAHDRRANDPGTPSEEREMLRHRVLDAVGVMAEDFASVIALSHRLAAALEENARAAGPILRNRNLDRTAREKAISELRAKRDASIDAAIQELREVIGVDRFPDFDRRIRQ